MRATWSGETNHNTRCPGGTEQIFLVVGRLGVACADVTDGADFHFMMPVVLQKLHTRCQTAMWTDFTFCAARHYSRCVCRVSSSSVCMYAALCVCRNGLAWGVKQTSALGFHFLPSSIARPLNRKPRAYFETTPEPSNEQHAKPRRGRKWQPRESAARRRHILENINHFLFLRRESWKGNVSTAKSTDRAREKERESAKNAEKSFPISGVEFVLFFCVSFSGHAR